MNTNSDHNDDFLDKDLSRDESSAPEPALNSDSNEEIDTSKISTESPEQLHSNEEEGLDTEDPDAIETESRRAEAMVDAQKALKLAAELKLMSINVAVEAAKRKGDPYQLREIKKSIGALANRAMKASNQMDEFISSCRGEDKVSGSEKSDYLQAVELSRELRSILTRTQNALAAIDSNDGKTRGLFGATS